MDVRVGLGIDVATCRRNRNKQRDRRRDKWRKHKNHSQEEDPDKEEGGLSVPFNFEQPGIYCTRTFPISSRVLALVSPEENKIDIKVLCSPFCVIQIWASSALLRTTLCHSSPLHLRRPPRLLQHLRRFRPRGNRISWTSSSPTLSRTCGDWRRRRSGGRGRDSAWSG